MNVELSGEGRRFVGADLGGSRTRVVVMDAAGLVIHRAEGEGVNWLTTARSGVPENIERVFARALDGQGRRVAATVIGVAGVLPFEEPPTRAFRQMLLALDVTHDPVVMNDLELLFRSFAGWRSGLAQVAGTGTIAARFSESFLTRTVDGYGPTLGDSGSGYWLGREALRLALREVDGRAPRSGLSQIVLHHLTSLGLIPSSEVCPDHVWGIVNAIDSGPRSVVADLARVVIEAAARLPEAMSLVAGAAAELTGSLSALDPQPHESLVLGGSLLTHDNPLSAAVMSWADQQQLEVTVGRDVALAAAELAAAEIPSRDG
ncbi:N-acetylglucosamine kinase [Microbacterium sp. W4I20]|uniref:N-acetylglucosamine kinase n=1 Tax=Microbacterium sp. W4I20 TaxID=3042262 RepID=UPI00278682BE|nr:BadF/BadG/BcrA/BcrD ATPase family protein [Microbacterium sp. W4I20]MDQ0726715.1 glucosamine kinase [Microbacterium sp. W4I20]